jgi:PAS domain S-box-containing protein
MALYTFYCCVLDGSAPTLEAHEFSTDDAAVEHCDVLLKSHRSCSHIIVANRETDIATVSRETAPLPTPVVPFQETTLPQTLRRALERPGLEGSGVALIATTLDGTIAYWNEAAATLYGWSSEATMGLSIMDVTPALQAKEQAAEVMAHVHDGQAWEGEIVLRHRDGTPFRAFVIDVPVALGRGYIVGASAPSSQRKRVKALKPLLLDAFAANDTARSLA